MDLTPQRPNGGSKSENEDELISRKTLMDSTTSKTQFLEESENKQTMRKCGWYTNSDKECGGRTLNGAVATDLDRDISNAAALNPTVDSTMNWHGKSMKAGMASSNSMPAPEALVPFGVVTGEKVSRTATTADSGKLFITNFRLHHHSPQDSDVVINVPLGLIESVELRDPFVLTVYCKNGPVYHIPFEEQPKAGNTAEDWLKLVSDTTSATEKVEDAFAFTHGVGPTVSGQGLIKSKQDNHVQALATDDSLLLMTGESEHVANAILDKEDTLSSLAKSCLAVGAAGGCSSTSWFQSEIKRLGFDLQVSWRITQVNVDHKLCPTYPEEILVPHSVSDADLVKAASFRWSRRIPSVVYRHLRTGAILARCSQPEVGILGWRSKEDEKVIRAIYDACASSSSEVASTSATNQSGNDSETNSISNGCDNIKDLSAEAGNMRKVPKVLMVDARSYAAAVGNRARGGGVECEEYYENTEVVFMNLANIHTIRKSFQALRVLLNAPSDQSGGSWFQSLDSTKWLSHLSSLLKASVRCAKALDDEGRPVIVHCSDGWDRTPQIVSITQILLDPYYRTMEGFQVIIEKDWLDYGHKMADRCGNAVSVPDPNERSPIFLQWLDCVHQLVRQFPCNFEFNASYLVKLATHVYSHLFGTFLCNTQLERKNANIGEKTTSVFDFLRGYPGKFRNYLHLGDRDDDILWPKCDLSNLLVWKEVYLSSRSPKVPPMFSACWNSDENQTTKSELASPSISNSASGRASSTPSSAPMSDSEDVDVPSTGTLTLLPQSDNSADSCQTLSTHNCDQFLLNGAVKSREVNNSVKECQHGDRDGDVKSQELVQDSTLLPMLNRPLISSTGVESSTDTLVPESDVEEQRERYSSALLQEQHILHQYPARMLDKKQQQMSTNHLPLRSVGTNSKREPNKANILTTLGQDQEGRRSMMFEVSYDSDGLLSISDPVQETLSGLLKTHREEVESLRKELCITRKRLIRRSSEGPTTSSTYAGAHASTVRPSSCSDYRDAKNYNIKSSKTSAISVASSWENVDESDMSVGMWSAPADSLSTMNCQRCQTSIWAGKRKFTCHHCAQFFCRNCFDLFFWVSASSSAATSSSNEETTYSGDGTGAGRYVRESNGEATLTLPRGFKVCGECFRELNSDAERESSKGDDEEAEDEYLVAELELLGGGKRTLSADATDGNTTMNIDAPREGE